MVKHVVMWRFDHTDEIVKKGNIKVVKNLLMGLSEKIPQLEDLEVGENFNPSELSFDLVLITTHVDKNALEEYRVNPLHQKIANRIKKLTVDRVVVDFEY